MEKKGGLRDFEHGTSAGVRQAGTANVFQELVIYWENYHLSLGSGWKRENIQWAAALWVKHWVKLNFSLHLPKMPVVLSFPGGNAWIRCHTFFHSESNFIFICCLVKFEQ